MQHATAPTTRPATPEQRRPLVSMTPDLEGNAFILVMRAKEAMREARVSHMEIEVFMHQCWQEKVVATPTHEMTDELWQRVLSAVSARCEIYWGD